MKEKNAEISARIDEVICILHTNPNKFANALGYKRAQTIYDILEGKSAPSYDFFNRFVKSGYSVFINLRWLLSGEGFPIIEETYLQSDLPIIKREMTSEEAAQRLEKIRARKGYSPAIEANNQDSTIKHILETMDKKDTIIKEQAEEIGQLRERIAQLQREKGKAVSDAQISCIANVG